MDKLFIDANVIIDFLVLREPFFDEALKLFSHLDKKSFKAYVSPLSIVLADYFLKKDVREYRLIMADFLSRFEFIDLNKELLFQAIDLNWSDFEDAVQYSSAMLVNCDFIITRDKKGFKKSKIEVLDAQEYLLRKGLF